MDETVSSELLQQLEDVIANQTRGEAVLIEKALLYRLRSVVQEQVKQLDKLEMSNALLLESVEEAGAILSHASEEANGNPVQDPPLDPEKEILRQRCSTLQQELNDVAGEFKRLSNQFNKLVFSIIKPEGGQQ